MLEHAIAHAESTRDCERSSADEPISWTTGVGGARPATSDAAGTEAVTYRVERVAREG
jgi:hypothetical protein